MASPSNLGLSYDKVHELILNLWVEMNPEGIQENPIPASKKNQQNA